MPWARRHPILLGVILLPVVLVAGLWANDSLQRRAFYEKHRLLKEMDEYSTSVEMRRPIILRHVPLGTSRPEAMRVLSQEGFHCQPWTDSARVNRVDCSLLQQPASFGQTGRRLIQLSFNKDETLVDASEFPLK